MKTLTNKNLQSSPLVSFLGKGALLLMVLFLLSSCGIFDKVAPDPEIAEPTKFSPRWGHTSVVFKEKLWVIGGSSGSSDSDSFLNDVWSSTNGSYWIKELANGATGHFSRRNAHSSVVFDNKMWVIGGVVNSGFANDIWSSPDGKTWTKRFDFPITNAPAFNSAVVHNGKIFVTTTSTEIIVISLTSYKILYHTIVWSSSDGASWTTETVNANNNFTNGYMYHQSVSHANKIFLLGGVESLTSSTGQILSTLVYHENWSSANGVDWQQITSVTPFPKRIGHSGFVFNNKIWVIGGGHTQQADAGYNDVWSSTDGTTWAQTTTTGLIFSKRVSHTSVVFKNKMWVIGGVGSIVYDDVWSSSDGATWAKEEQKEE